MASCSAHVGTSQSVGGCTSTQLSEHFGLDLQGALVGAMVGACVGTGHGSAASGGNGVEGQAAQMPQVCSQMPSARMARSGHLPVASCSAHVLLPHSEGGCTSAQSAEHGDKVGVGALVGASVGAVVGEAVGGEGALEHAVQMLHVCSQ